MKIPPSCPLPPNPVNKEGEEIALEARARDKERLFSPSVSRNRDIICETFLKVMPDKGRVLEVGSGTGEHGVHIAKQLPNVTWYGGDPDEASRASLRAWICYSGLQNLEYPHAIDVTGSDWGSIENFTFQGMLSVNMIHIAPFDAARGLIAGAGRLLQSGGKLFLYGPFSRNGVHISPSNAQFDVSLKSRNPQWGVRDLDDEIILLAQESGLELTEIIAMPANNLSVVFMRQ